MKRWLAIIAVTGLVVALLGCGDGGRFSEIAAGESFTGENGLKLSVPQGAVGDLQTPGLNEHPPPDFLELLNIRTANSLDVSVISYSQKPPTTPGKVVARSETVTVRQLNSASIRAVVDTMLPGRRFGRVVVIAPSTRSDTPTGALQAASMAWEVLKIEGADLPTK